MEQQQGARFPFKLVKKTTRESTRPAASSSPEQNQRGRPKSPPRWWPTAAAADSENAEAAVADKRTPLEGDDSYNERYTDASTDQGTPRDNMATSAAAGALQDKDSDSDIVVVLNSVSMEAMAPPEHATATSPMRAVPMQFSAVETPPLGSQITAASQPPLQLSPLENLQQCKTAAEVLKVM